MIGINSLRAGQQAEGVAFAVAIDHATQLLNGERVTDTQTPLGSLTQMLDGRSDGDQQRARGEQEYGRHARGGGARGRRARLAVDPLRAELRRPPRRAAGDRPWFAVYEADGVRIGTSSTAATAPRGSTTMTTRADSFRGEVEKAAEPRASAASSPARPRPATAVPPGVDRLGSLALLAPTAGLRLRGSSGSEVGLLRDPEPDPGPESLEAWP